MNESWFPFPIYNFPSTGIARSQSNATHLLFGDWMPGHRSYIGHLRPGVSLRQHEF
jgi:hypothetical protein